MAEQNTNSTTPATNTPLPNAQTGENKSSKEPKVPEGMSLVPTETLERILSEIGTLKQQQNELTQTASVDQIKRIEALRAQGRLVKSIKVPFYNDKMVKSWVSTADDVYFDSVAGKEVSRQMTRIEFFDGKPLEISQLDFARNKKFQSFDVISEKRDQLGNLILSFMTEDGQEISIDAKYVN